MTNTISYTALAALGLAIVAGSSVADAQTVITREISDQPVETVITRQPVQTVRTIETVRTVRPVRPGARTTVRHRVVTTRQTVVQRVTPAQPVYDVVPPAPVVATPVYPPPLYDRVVPAPTVDDTVIDAAPPAVATMPPYRYVYEPDRILVIDPVTNITIQAIPR